MFGIVIDYNFSGDEAAWREAIDTFLGHIDADDRLKGRFSYQVNTCKEGPGRIHIGNWDDETTLKHMQSQPYFPEFATKLKGFANGSLKSTGFKCLGKTSGLSEL